MNHVHQLLAMNCNTMKILDNYQNLTQAANQFLLKAKGNKMTYNVPFTLFPPLSGTLVNPTVNLKEEIQHIEVSKILLDIKNSDEICCRSQIAFIGSDVLLPSYNKPYRVIRLNQEGDVVARYYPKIPGEMVCGVAVYDQLHKYCTTSGHHCYNTCSCICGCVCTQPHVILLKYGEI